MNPWKAMWAALRGWMNAYTISGDSLKDYQLPPKIQEVSYQPEQQEPTQNQWTSQLPRGLYHKRNVAAALQRAYVSMVLEQAIRQDHVQIVQDNDLYVQLLQSLDISPVAP